MRLNILKAIYKKEMVDLIRDRRTLISMVVVPVLVIPLMIMVMTRVTASMSQKSKDDAKSLTVDVHAADPEVAEALKKAGIHVSEKGADARASVEKKDASVGVAEIAGATPVIQVFADESSGSSRALADRVRIALNELKDQRIRQKLQASGVPESVLTPFQVRRVNVAPERKMAGMIWGTMLGYMLLLLMFSGGMYPVIDMTAGEKERKTMETLLSSPAGRNEIVLGKILAAMTAIGLTAALTLTSLVVSVRSNRTDSADPDMKVMMQSFPLDAHTLSLIALTMLPVVIFAASVMIAIAIHARSFKEGTSYLTPLIFLVIFPALLGGLPGMELTPALCLIPVFNASMLIRAIMLGEFHVSAFLITFAANFTYAAIAFWIAKQRFENEAVLFRS